jgi:hypothetical protein
VKIYKSELYLHSILNYLLINEQDYIKLFCRKGMKQRLVNKKQTIRKGVSQYHTYHSKQYKSDVHKNIYYVLYLFQDGNSTIKV